MRLGIKRTLSYNNFGKEKKARWCTRMRVTASDLDSLHRAKRRQPSKFAQACAVRSRLWNTCAWYIDPHPSIHIEIPGCSTLYRRSSTGEGRSVGSALKAGGRMSSQQPWTHNFHCSFFPTPIERRAERHRAQAKGAIHLRLIGSDPNQNTEFTLSSAARLTPELHG